MPEMPILSFVYTYIQIMTPSDCHFSHLRTSAQNKTTEMAKRPGHIEYSAQQSRIKATVLCSGDQITNDSILIKYLRRLRKSEQQNGPQEYTWAYHNLHFLP